MLSILVCHSYYLHFDQKQVLRAKPYPPLATLQVVALLRKAGHRVSFFDSMLAEGIDEYDRLLETDEPQLVLFYEDNFNFLSKMCLGTMRRAACEMIASARRVGARVIAAGPDVTDAPGHYLKAGADLALIGEGLSALFEVLPRIDAHPDADNADLAHGLAGIASLSGGGKVLTKSGSKMMPIATEVGLAAWDLVDMDRYRAMWLKAHGYFSLNMAASRGCPFRCAWCAKPIWGNQYLQRNATEVAEELVYLKRTFNPDHIWFADDIFGFRVDWVEEFAASVRAADALVPFTIQTRADLVSERMAEVLRDAGCREAWIGAESGSQRVLDAMNKGTTVEEIRVARERLKAVGIRVGFFIQLGYMDEQLSDILATRDLIEAARPDEIGVSVSYPLPGTKFYDLVKAQLHGKTHWQESNDLEMMFQGTYKSDFYRAIRDLLHDQVSLQTAGTPHDSVEYGRASQTTEQRWQALLSRELQYRSPVRRSAAIG
ncbi:MAG: anaerobic magnesium-protoporphyrin monomethyl ester cyclase [Gammaproteobacteria bacterium]|jgi:anaerobic magnesium-protoporphyrin IX monomethyl ester cyclase|nr:anaerobic magnesium-protoporphyrin monomethyl ester cyclase [Gammaproteobacteria bacterium]